MIFVLKTIGLLIVWIIVLVVIALCDMAGRNREEKKEELESEVKGMAKYNCGRPEWADEEDCPLDTGEVKDCAECYWGKAKEEG